MGPFADIAVTTSGHVATIEIKRPPHNFFDMPLIKQLADAFEGLDKDRNIRALVLCAEGKSFCAGANFGDGSKLDKDGKRPDEGTRENPGHLYQEAVRLFRTKKPIIGAIQGPAIGGGLGLALVPDFRVTCSEGRFSTSIFHDKFANRFKKQIISNVPQISKLPYDNMLLVRFSGCNLAGLYMHTPQFV